MIATCLRYTKHTTLPCMFSLSHTCTHAQTAIVERISQSNPGRVQCVVEKDLTLDDDDYVVFTELNGMHQLTTAGPVKVSNVSKVRVFCICVCVHLHVHLHMSLCNDICLDVCMCMHVYMLAYHQNQYIPSRFRTHPNIHTSTHRRASALTSATRAALTRTLVAGL